jgi:hypothetical protein
MRLRLGAIFSMLLLAGCGGPPARESADRPSGSDPTQDKGYTEAVAQLAALDREAERLWRAGRADEAAAAIVKGQPIAARVLSAPRPTLAAMEAASDLDELYARMLLANRNVGWARMMFQKNVTRWKAWKPRTEETARRLKQAEDGIAECDRRLGE